jgi:ATP-dependent Clp protease ATP-binding subunit ClpB
LRKRLADRHITLELTESAREFIAREAYDPVYGARPLKRYLQHELETRLARALIGGEIRDGAAITVDARSDSLTVEAKNPAEVGSQEEVR